MSRRLSLILVAAAATWLMIASCAGLPKPNSATDTIVVIATETTVNGEVPSTDHRVEIRVATPDGAFTKWFHFTPADRPFALIRHLPPGEYLITHSRLTSGPAGSVGLVKTVGVSFSVVPGALTIAPTVFSITWTDRSSGSSRGWSVSYYWRPLRHADSVKLIGAIYGRDRLAEWQIADETAQLPGVQETLSGMSAGERR